MESFVKYIVENMNKEKRKDEQLEVQDINTYEVIIVKD